jgi:hypothetical protein
MFIDQPELRVEEPRPKDANHNKGHDNGHKKACAIEGTTAQGLVEQQRQKEG